MSTFEEQMRAAFADESTAPPPTVTAPSAGALSLKPIVIESMPRRGPSIGTIMRDQFGEITGILMEPVESVSRDERGELLSYVVDKGD